MGFDEWWQLNARFGDDKVRLRQLWSAAIECAQRETVRYAEAQVAAERERFTTPAAMAEHALLYAAFDGAPGATTPADVLCAARLLFGDAAVDAAVAKYRRPNARANLTDTAR
jgi:hypothetical protein